MEMSVMPSEKKRFMVVENETINGVMFNFQSLIDGDDLLANLDDIDVRIVEQLDKKETYTVFNGTLLDIFAITYCNNYPLAQKTFMRGRTIDGSNTYQLPFYFGTNYNLKDGNALFVECYNKKLKDNANIMFDNTMVVETIPSIGLKLFIPTIEVRELEATLERHDLNLDSSVHQVIYLPPNGASGEFDVKRISYKSDKLNEEMSANNLYSQLSNTVEPDQDYGGTPIYLLNSEQPLHKLNLRVDFTNALANRRLVIVRKVQTPAIVNAFTKKQAEHLEENMTAIKTGVTSSNCLCTH